ncbi:MAG: hypothetical protein ABIN67_13845 [Ferruginibacter sp.]
MKIKDFVCYCFKLIIFDLSITTKKPQTMYKVQLSRKTKHSPDPSVFVFNYENFEQAFLKFHEQIQDESQLLSVVNGKSNIKLFNRLGEETKNFTVNSNHAASVMPKIKDALPL